MFYVGDGDDIYIQCVEFCQCWQGGLQVNSGESGVDVDGQIIGYDFEDMVVDFLWIVVVVCEFLQVGDQDKLLVVMLQCDVLVQ